MIIMNTSGLSLLAAATLAAAPVKMSNGMLTGSNAMTRYTLTRTKPAAARANWRGWRRRSMTS